MIPEFTVTLLEVNCGCYCLSVGVTEDGLQVGVTEDGLQVIFLGRESIFQGLGGFLLLEFTG